MRSSVFEKNWQALEAHQKALEGVSLKKLFQQNEKRFEELSVEFGDILFDFSKQCITVDTINKLCLLAESAELIQYRSKLFAGEKLNETEGRSVLHTLLRDSSHAPFHYQGKNIKETIQQELLKMETFAEAIRNGGKKGVTGKAFTDVLCLGIGGSELGPSLVSAALQVQERSGQSHEGHENHENHKSHVLNLHFISNIDGQTLENLLGKLNPEKTLCIISSKTFTTPETLTNALAVKEWYRLAGERKQASSQEQASSFCAHFCAVTANHAKALAFGVPSSQIFEFWEWVGGRYSIWSAVGLPVILKYGFSTFQDFLEGAFEMDQHFLEAPLHQNAPVLMALIGIWNNNFLNYPALAVLPYENALGLLPAYLQQLEMESNGKAVNKQGEPCSFPTTPILFGGIGCNGQHAYMQWLHQGNRSIPVDFLIPAKIDTLYSDHHKLLLASCLSQSKALMEGEEDNLLYKSCPGNRPSTTILYSKLTPKILGSLIALYEHKVFVQGIIWGINSFDQWGVELGKKLAKSILPFLDQKEISEGSSRGSSRGSSTLDSSTLGLIRFFHKKNSASS